MTTPLSDAPDPIAFLTPWTRRAERGERFDVAGGSGAFERTRARFDGKTLTLAHWLGRDAVAVLELRRADAGEWLGRPCSGAPLFGPLAIEAAGLSACQDLGEAFARAEPVEPLGWIRRVLWAARWPGGGAISR